MKHALRLGYERLRHLARRRVDHPITSFSTLLQRSSTMKRALEVLVVSALSAAALPALAQHTATINQQGSLSTATIDQLIGIPPFEASIFQGPGTGNRAGIVQSGIEVHASISQYGDRQTASVRQDVDAAHATVSQGGGSGNAAIIEQDAVGAIANVQQFGSRNVAAIDQVGRGLRADVNQQGSGNSVIIDQTGSFVLQTVTADQRGTNNHAEIGLNGPDQNRASLVQHGTDNLATIRGFGAQASISQDGAGNLGDISLNGAGSQGTIEQRGTANRAYIVSVGENNLATIRQGGQNNLARIDQNGAGLVATIVQNTLIPGYGNVASIIQH